MPHDSNHQENILNILQNFHGIDSLKELFWTELNYDHRNTPLSYQGGDALANDPILLASGGTDGVFHIIYTHLNSDRLPLTTERLLISQLLNDHRYALFIFSNNEQTHWHFVNVKYDTHNAKKRRLYRRITISPYEKLRTASERVAMLDLESISPNLESIPPLRIQARHEAAFDVEAVTKRFFEDYKSVFQSLQDDLAAQIQDRRWVHDYALQFLNRCMFLYFIQRKRWLGEDTGFLRSFWESYRSADEPEDSFVEQWLNVLFFEAFNNRFHGGHRQFPDEIRKALALAPYLNGGLFTENDPDEAHNFQISDVRFTGIFEFLENYNFTIAEDSPLDQEVAVDPEMIGKVYESLVNVSPETDERGDAGIFYTPRTEIDLMCRLAIVDNLAVHMGEEHKSTLYEAVFAFDPDEKTAADLRLNSENLWVPLNECLSEIAIVDPACGSGAFLVGMLHILDDLRDRANRHLGNDQLSFDRKKAIIGSNLYGVDVMEWACHVAELRLWLALIIDADIPRAELQVRNEPLLPHFSFNIRCGDSLIQEIGGMNLAQIRADFSRIPRSLKARTTRLKNEKLKFFNNDKTCRYESEQELKHEELNLFRDLVDTHVADIKKEIDALQDLIDGPRAQQIRLDGTIEERTAHQFELEATEWRKQIEAMTIDYNRLVEARGALANARTLPFVWDIAFAEIFAEDKGGFDIVIGNPPYVRQENIADPKISREKVTTARKSAYKAKLARSVYQAFPRFFGYKREKDVKPNNPAAAVSHKLDAKSDLYIYFYFHGLSLLNPKGSFCFITSNSWLDVGYGKDLQEFALKHCHIKQIIDNRSRRSFASADVNTVICLFATPDESRQLGLDCTTRFVSFNTPFEAILDPVIFYEIETASERDSTQEHRVFPISQTSLLKDGIVDASPKPKYTGDKWGGKYLRAPDIYWTILEKGKGKLVSIEPSLGEVMTVSWSRQGRNSEIMSGENLDLGETTIPVLKSPREFGGIIIESSDIKTHLRTDLIDEKQIVRTPLVWDDIRGERHICRFNPEMLAFTHNFHGIWLHNPDLAWQICACLNSTLTWFFVETLGRRGLGGGAVRILVKDLKRTPLLIPPDYLNSESKKALHAAFTDLTLRSVGSIRQEITTNDDEIFGVAPDRRALDAIIFDTLNLTQGERDAVYEAVIDLVEARLQKASSLK